jgi:predicted ATPase/class 3 adenylate cyclase
MTETTARQRVRAPLRSADFQKPYSGHSPQQPAIMSAILSPLEPFLSEGVVALMQNPPSGTVTFLFTDIEGSTKRWEANPAAMQLAFSRHEAILRHAIQADGGYAYKMIGDAFQAAFPTALQALQAAIDAQHALYSEKWPAETGDIRVRMALHTGATEERDDDYVGPALNRAARLLSAGHGGQTLLSLATEQLVRDNLPQLVTLTDMGEHRLKDLQQPEHIYQLVILDLPSTSSFPPLNTLDARPNNLPFQRSPMVGRAVELESIRRLLLRADVGLLTLTGPGGIGKTRLALQVAAELIDEFEDGVFFVSLANIADPDLVSSAIAQTLGLRETAGQETIDSLADYLSDKQLLLLLDNFEQVVGAAPLVVKLLAAAPRLKVLVTSREVLHVHDEQEFAVPPLGVPDPSTFARLAPFVKDSLSPGTTTVSRAMGEYPSSGSTNTPGRAENRLLLVEALPEYESVALFVQRARLVKPDFELTGENALAVAEICYRLDGLPLAIELSAARIRILSPQAMLDRLQSRFKLLTGGGRDLPARQQTLRGAIEWSYDLLRPGEQLLFRRLSVFAGGATLEAIEAVCNADGALELDVLDGVASLVDKSLVRQEQTEPRFGMLETIREFAMELLHNSRPLQAEPEAEQIYRYRAEYFLALAEQSWEGLQGHRQEEWMERLATEQANFQSVMKWAVEQQQGEVAMRLGAALWMFWGLREFDNNEGIKWLREAFCIPGAEVRNEARAMALVCAAMASFNHAGFVAARTYCEESIAILRELGPGATRELGIALFVYSSALAFTGEPEAARAAVEESTAVLRQAGDKWSLSFALFASGTIASAQGDYASARRVLEERIALSTEVRNIWVLAQSLNSLGDLLRIEGDYVRAREEYEQSLVLLRRLNSRGDIPALLHNLGHVDLAQGEVQEAKKRFIEALHLHMAHRNRVGIAECLAGLGAVAGAEKRPERATRLLGAAIALREAAGAMVYVYDAERVDYERNVANARAQLGGEPEKAAAWEKAWQEGRAMSIEQAIEYARGRD